MNAPPSPPARADILLHPGDWTVTAGPVVLRTLLGSCVAITLWHPPTRIGAMCHYLLPAPHRRIGREEAGRYGTTVFARLQAELHAEKVRLEECEAKLFGGGNMLEPSLTGNLIGEQVGKRNIEIGRRMLQEHGVPLVAEHCGGRGHRTVLFELWSGRAWVRHVGTASPDGFAPQGNEQEGL